jgi:hypothetical protein
MKNLLFLLAISLLGCASHAQTNNPVRVAQPYIFSTYIQVKDSARAALFLTGKDTVAVNSYVRTFMDTAILSSDTIYFKKANGAVFYAVVPILTSTQISQLAASYSSITPARFDTAARLLYLTSNNGSVTQVSIPYGTGGGGGSGITSQTSSKAGNLVTLTANTSATVSFSVHDTNFNYSDTTVWNGKMDSAQVNARFVPFSDTSAMLGAYLRVFLGMKYTDSATLIASQWLLRKVVDSALASIISGVSSVNGLSGAVTLTSTNIAEGTNQYFTQARARAALNSTAPLIYNSGTGGLSVDTSTQATGLSTIAGARRIADSAASAIGVPVQSVNGLTGVVVLTSTNIAEGTNQYFTQARARAALSATAPLLYNSSTGGLSIDTSTQSTGLSTISGGRRIADSAASAALSAANTAIAALTTSNIPEGLNLYFTQARARAALSASAPLIYNSSTGGLLVDTTTQATGLSTIAGARRIADSAAAQAVGSPYTGNAPVAINSRVVSVDTATNVSGLLTRADGRRIADSAAAQAAGASYTASAPIIITSRNISADTTTQTTGLSTIAGARKIADSASNYVDTLKFFYVGSGVKPGYKMGSDSQALRNINAINGVIGGLNSDSSLSLQVDSSAYPTWARMYKVADSLAASLSATFTARSPLIYNSNILSVDTATQTTGLSTIAGARRIADSALAASTAAVGYNVQFLYGRGTGGIPIKNTDSVYINSNLVGKNVQVFVSASGYSSFLQDSATWALLGSPDSVLYFRYNKTFGQLTFSNFGKVAGILNGHTVISIFGGLQGYPANLDTGTGPTLVVNPSILSGFSTVTGTQSASQNFTVSGTNLTANAIVTAPTNYVVSLSSGSGYGSSVTVTESGGTISTTTVYTAIAGSAPIGSPSGNISVASTGATTQTVRVSGTVTSSPTLTVTPTSLTGFATTTGTPSPSKSFTLTGAGLSANATITAPSNYQVSLDNVSFSGSLTVSESGGTIASTTIYVEIASTAPVGSPSGNVTAASSGATTQNVAVSGTVTAVPLLSVTPGSLSGFSTTVGSQSGSQTFALTGSNLTANATVTAPSGYVVSLSSGSGYGSSVTVTESGGTISSTTIYVAIASTASVGTVSGNVTSASTGATTQNVAVTGTVSSGTALDSIRVQFSDSTGDIAQSGWKQMTGDIATHSGNISVTGGLSNTIIVTATKANWYPTNPNNFGSGTATAVYTCSYTPFSINTTNVLFPYATDVMSGLWYNSTAGTAGSGSGGTIPPQITISGLIPGHNYSMSISAACTQALFNAAANTQETQYFAGSPLTSIIAAANNTVPMCDQGSGTPTNSTVMGLFNVANSTQLTADSNGDIFIWFIANDAGSVAGVSAFVLTQLN